MSMKSGIYVVELLNDKPIFTNAHDKRTGKQGTLVQKGNVKFGKAKDLDIRQRNYLKTFGKNNFIFHIVYLTNEIDLYEKLIIDKVHEFRIRSINGRKLEWLEGISAEILIGLIRTTIKEHTLIKSNYIILDTRPSYIICDGKWREKRIKSCLYACNQHWENLKEINSEFKLCSICNKEIQESKCKLIRAEDFDDFIDVSRFSLNENRKFVYKNKLHMFYDRQVRHRLLKLFGKYEYKDVLERYSE